MLIRYIDRWGGAGGGIRHNYDSKHTPCTEHRHELDQHFTGRDAWQVKRRKKRKKFNMY